jgi:hypothetical protein
MFVRRVFLLLGAVALIAACGPAAEGSNTDLPDTVPIGDLPPAATAATTDETPSTVLRTTVPLAPDEQVGALAAGNRVIVIGDSVLASTSRRYSNDMCEALVPLGWQVELDAETGRFVEFGHEVLDDRLSAGWDASVILLGNNYREDQAEYREELERMVQRLSPQPVVLLTVTEFAPSRADVNQVIFDLAEIYENVLIVDWGVTSAADPTLTGGDGLHLTDEGRVAISQQVALALGTTSGEGRCLTTSFEDDSSGGVDGTTTTTVKRTNGTPTTKASQPSTTKATQPPTTEAEEPPPTDPPPTT